MTIKDAALEFFLPTIAAQVEVELEPSVWQEIQERLDSMKAKSRSSQISLTSKRVSFMEDVFPPEPLPSKTSQEIVESQNSALDSALKASFTRYSIDRFMSLIDLELACTDEYFVQVPFLLMSTIFQAVEIQV